MQILQDVRYALRALARRPGFAASAILTLALGIGANTAVFSLVEGVLLRPLPFQEPERLVMVWENNTVRHRARNVASPANYLAWEERNRVFESLTAFVGFPANVTGEGEPVRLDAGVVMPSFFTTLGAAPLLGRVFDAHDGQPGAEGVVLLAEALWKGRFGGDPAVVGKRLVFNGRERTIVGVMPARFQVPAGAQVWVPFTVDEQLRAARGRYLSAVGRLKPGVNVAEARAEMETIAAQLSKEFPDNNSGWSVTVAPLHADLVRDARPAVLVLAGAVAFVLLIACANIANLLLARALGRQREIAIRQSLGAGRARLIRQLLTESLVLALLGGIAGVAASQWILGALAAAVPSQVTALVPIELNLPVLAFSSGLCLLCALLFGVAPAWHTARVELRSALHDGAAGSGASRERRRLGRLLVASEIGLSVMLLVGAALLLRSFERLSRVHPGFEPAGVLSFQVNLPGVGYEDPARSVRFFMEAAEGLSRIPGVESAAGISWRPIGTLGSSTSFAVTDRPRPDPGQRPAGDVRIVTPGLFRTLGVPLRLGRDFEARDRAEAPRVVIVNEQLVREFWPRQSPLGKRLVMWWGNQIEAEVVGVVGDVRLVGLDTRPRPAMYWPVTQLPNSFMTLLVRSSRPQSALLQPIKRQIAALDPQVPLASVAALEDVLDESLRRPRFLFSLVLAFAFCAALLAGIGLFGVLSYSVAQRVPELGVRLALGASPQDVRRLVLAEGARLAAAGAAAGLVAALLLSRTLQDLLFETSARDPLAFAATAALVLGVSLLAAYWPARRASRVDPSLALRAE
jgi:putative ABC transport system permease protein